MVKKEKLTRLSDLFSLPYDEIIDVRAPSEFAEDHVPGAISLPVLSDAERAEVGTIYVQQDPFLARKLGAALVAQNAAKHLQGPLFDRTGGWRPLVYCWRGGQRSGSFASILDQIGWRVGLIEGGYKTYRRLVVQALYEDPVPHRLILIDGGTGTGKTRLLDQLQQDGAQVLDLEAMAEHRGSLLGGYAGGQPSQKDFESRVAMALLRLDPERPVFVEAESNKIGRLIIPPTLWQKMLQADHLLITAPLEARARFLTEAYRDVIDDTDVLCETLSYLVRFHGAEVVEHWQQLARAGSHRQLARELVEQHYDPSYRRSSRRARAPLAEIALTGLEAADLQMAATQIQDVLDLPS
ncbi:tRNA 2-selenouridine synthase [Thalassovita gelatinovora]|uniref:tRNA 2-selenouridine synthase n=1 Tax=Thalassovita gelatinovora TaxID=53501 RepID=A0A0P1FKQ2_THAGE|nr:tRNA 2-selenouridine(34) synthase MnmH [Thalassovita gelatinovora]QIZ82373.1 tRNA 2-selenouridine(34) synthase MnmH [Thalassovita gelatinovora]CUH68444.1 tRNA 2-selenouridine synthase [Thalassovita gelatinovora]SEQ52290.1 tRNA 2-selenouridine synthase [Thalassovita gelatinovora]